MTISFTITAETPEVLTGQVAWLAQKLGAADIIGQVRKMEAEEQAEVVITKAKAKPKKAQPEVAENTGSNGSDQTEVPSSPCADAQVCTPSLPKEDASTLTDAQSEAVAPSHSASSADKQAVQKLAQAKSKTSGAQAVKDAIARFGGKSINETPADKLAELKDALEALA